MNWNKQNPQIQASEQCHSSFIWIALHNFKDLFLDKLFSSVCFKFTITSKVICQRMWLAVFEFMMVWEH